MLLTLAAAARVPFALDELGARAARDEAGVDAAGEQLLDRGHAVVAHVAGVAVDVRRDVSAVLERSRLVRERAHERSDAVFVLSCEGKALADGLVQLARALVADVAADEHGAERQR